MQFLRNRQGLVLQGMLIASPLVAIAGLATYLALQPARAVQGQEGQGQTYTVSLDGTDNPLSIGEGEYITVEVWLKPFLEDAMSDSGDEPECYGPHNMVGPPCIEGGIIVWDDYHDEYFAHKLIAFRFRPGQILPRNCPI